MALGYHSEILLITVSMVIVTVAAEVKAVSMVARSCESGFVEHVENPAINICLYGHLCNLGIQYRDVRLVGGSRYEGGVEEFVGNKWTSLCGDVCWTSNHAKVVCKELGHRGDSQVRYNCDGTETSLDMCINKNTCTNASCRKSGAGVSCLGAIRLTGHSDRTRVDILRSNNLPNGTQWGAVCGDQYHWSTPNTNVVCKQRGFRYGVWKSGSMPNRTRIRGNNIRYYNCTGKEAGLADCKNGFSSRHECELDLIVSCKKEAYNQPCGDDPHVCMEGLVCKTRQQSSLSVCRCRNETSQFWSGDTCKEKKNYNKTCDEVQTGSCLEGLMCKEVQGSNQRHACKCNDEGKHFWNQQASECEQSNYRSPYDHECVPDNPRSCLDPLVCTRNGTRHVCRCETTHYWDLSRCFRRVDYNQTCIPKIKYTCKENLTCTDIGPEFVCRCEDPINTLLNKQSQICEQKHSFNGSCESNDMYAGDLVCGSQREKICTCMADTDVWHSTTATCRQVPATPDPISTVFVTQTLAFESAKSYCSNSWNASLVSTDIVEHVSVSVSVECLNENQEIWLEGTRGGCSVGRMVNGTMAIGVTDKDCTGMLPFLCVTNQSAVAYESNCTSVNKPDKVEEGVQPIELMPLVIYIAISSACLLILIIVAIVCIKRRKNNTKHEEDLPMENKSSAGPYSYVPIEPGSGLNDENNTHATSSDPHENGNPEGLYCLAQGSVPDSTSNECPIETDHYGYGVLGGKPIVHAEDDMYSHARSGQHTENDYDMFVNKGERLADDIDLYYDGTKAVLQENAYDEFQGQNRQEEIGELYNTTSDINPV